MANSASITFRLDYYVTLCLSSMIIALLSSAVDCAVICATSMSDSFTRESLLLSIDNERYSCNLRLRGLKPVEDEDCRQYLSEILQTLLS